MSFGPHITFDISNSNAGLLTLTDIHEFFADMIKQIGMTAITQPYVFPYEGIVPEDKGITGIVVIAESHISCHTFSEKGYIFIDVFSCKPFDTKKAKEVVDNHFNGDKVVKVVKRGINFPR